MIIYHNLVSQNIHNKLNKSNTNKSKAMEKLSSGLRINKASDDSAGLSISQKMKAQIRGLEQAQRNIQDGISLVQTAEGGLNEITSYLQRIRELAVQSANGTLTNDDREMIQKEVEQLKEGIDDIANNTEFNGIKLLNGDISKTQDNNITITANQIFTWKFDKDNVEVMDRIGYINSNLLGITFEIVPPGYSSGFVDVLIGSTLEESLHNVVNEFYRVKNDPTEHYHNATLGIDAMVYNDTLIFTSESNLRVGGSSVPDGTTYNEYVGNPYTLDLGSQATTTDNSLNLQVGANEGQTMKIDISGVTCNDLSINSMNVATQISANQAINNIDNAIKTVSAERSKLGAYQNLLEHTLNNVSNYNENLTAANSRIEDADMAKEIMEFSKSNILEQVAQGLLAQANQIPNKVLELLK